MKSREGLYKCYEYFSVTLAIEFAPFSVMSSTSGSEKNNGKLISISDHCKK